MRLSAGAVGAIFLFLPWGLNGGPDSSLSPELRNKLVSVAGRAGDIRILGLAGVMRNLTGTELAEVIDRGEGYLPVLAIVEGRERSDGSLHAAIRERFEQSVLQPAEIRFDPHSISPVAATFVACTAYLAAAEKVSFLPELLQRSEVWAIPSWFVATFRALGAGWVQPVIARANQLDTHTRLAVLMTVVADGATAANMDELRTILETETSDPWLAAMRACSRINTADCWDLIAVQAKRQGPREQLRAAMIEFEAHRIEVAGLFTAAENAAVTLRQPADPPKRAFLAMELGRFLRLLQSSKLDPPPSLVEAIQATRSQMLIRQLRISGGTHGNP